MDYYVPCIANGGSGQNIAHEAAWVGLGGLWGLDELIQTGSSSNETFGVYTYNTWYEYINSENQGINETAFNISGNPLYDSTGTIGCHTHVYAQVYAPDTYWLGNLDKGTYYSITAGPATAGATAEFISERGGPSANACSNYGSVTFDGVGLTAQDPVYCPSGCYIGMPKAEKDVIFNTNTGDWNGYALQDVGALASSSDYPGDKFTVWWLSAV